MANRTPRNLPMHRTLLLAAGLCSVLLPDLPAQGRGRRGSRPPAPTEEQAAPVVVEAAKPTKTKLHLAITGGDVYLGTGQRLTGATVLLADDKVLAIGHGLELPEGTKTLDAKGKVVSPGFVCAIAAGMGAPRGAPFVDSVNPYDPEIKQGLAAGITSFMAGSPGGGSMPSGSNAVVKLAFGDVKGMVLSENTVAAITLPLSLSDRRQFEEAVKGSKEYLTQLAEFPKQQAADPKAKPPAMPKGGDAIVPILKGERRLWVNLGGGGFNPFGGGRVGSASDLPAIREAMELSTLLGVGVVLQKPISAWLCADEVAATGSMVLLSPRDRVPADPKDPDRTGSNLASSALLAAAGVPVAVTCPVGMFGGAGVGTGGILGQDLNTPQVDAAFAVRGGMDNRKALRTLTLDAARLLGVDRRVGSLEPGKDADVLILTGDPLHYSTFVETAIVNGKVVYERANEPLYRDIQR